MGAAHFLTKTLPKVAAEIAISVRVYNLTRVMNIVRPKPETEPILPLIDFRGGRFYTAKTHTGSNVVRDIFGPRSRCGRARTFDKILLADVGTRQVPSSLESDFKPARHAEGNSHD